MYGKTLADYPERFDEFLEEFETTKPDVLDAAFKACRGACTEFPTPGDVRKQIPGVLSEMRHKQLEADSREISQRALKPDDWVPLEQLEATPQFQALVRKSRM